MRKCDYKAFSNASFSTNAQGEEKDKDDTDLEDQAFESYCVAKRAEVDKINLGDDANAMRILRACWGATSTKEKETYRKRKHVMLGDPFQDTTTAKQNNPFKQLEKWPEMILDVIIREGEFQHPPQTKAERVQAIRSYMFWC